MCIISMRVYSGCKPFIEKSHDRFSEVSQWQLLFTMLGALAMKINIDGENLQGKAHFDILLTILQFLPATITLCYNSFRATEQGVKAASRSKESAKKVLPE